MRKTPSNQTSEFEVEEQVIEPDSQLFNKEDIQMFPAGRHQWRQQGPYLVCRECPLYHAQYIGIDNVMTGEDEDGKPIVKSRQELFGNH